MQLWQINYFISKEVYSNRTKTLVKLLQEEEVIKEIARISSGEINEISLKYANELRNKKTVVMKEMDVLVS